MSGQRHLRAVGAAGDVPAAAPGPPHPARLSPHQLRDLRRARRAAVWVGVVLPLALTAAAAAILVAWSPRLPDPMATHWSGSGGPDGFMSPMAGILVFAGLGVGMSLLLGLLAVFGGGTGGSGARGGRGPGLVWSGMNRFLAAVSLWTVVLLMVLAVLSAQIQLDLSDARDAPGIGGAMWIAFGAAFAAGTVGFVAQPGVRVDVPATAEALAIELDEGERAVWTATIRPSAILVWVIAATVLLTLGTTIWLFLLGEPLAWMNLGITVLLIVLFSVGSWYRVRIDSGGLVARSLVGRPSFRVPTADVARVDARELNPFAEWGGWGLRWVPGTGFGIVMRTGEGILVTRRDGRIFAVTVDDAATGAALLEAVAERAARKQESNVRGDR
ncbi:DUF1648 domain-containing protein [Leucobacter triazinivorans]|uniref:DUF1648 domain-containing protein n=1 Tax=Leucobacter triazinivorans TaxID=1784719 RepID=UPI0013EE87F1|nr:DUF1648 domain-containing protein [Leucobacter triazinivorans]